MMMIAVGLILGTRMWYAMWDAENDDEAAFERRVDSVTREIGERGKLNVSESVPPVREAAPTPAPAPARSVAPAVSLAPSRAPAPAPALSSTTVAASDPSSLFPTSTLVSQPRGTAAITPNVASSVQNQQPTAQQQVSSSAHAALSGTGASLMEVSAFMTEQLKAQVVEQRAHDNEQHAEMLRLLVEREAKLEAKLEAKHAAQRKELEAQRQSYETKLEAQRKELEAQRQAYETKLEVQRKELEVQRQNCEKRLDTKLDAQRQAYETKLEAQRKDLEGKSEEHRDEMWGQARTHKVTALQLRFEALSESKLLEDEELSAIEDKVADAVGAAATEDGVDGAWECVMHMVRLSEGISSEKTFARQLRRKFL
eukprot:COSAG02_NODE_14_length_56855_cov_512.793661_33_plen_369_part_00